ncbi:MAG TPA: serine dehydratase beta chain, partial [Devosia sp.]|nr:serine dehydratase beta chain [Devosia sp.]
MFLSIFDIFKVSVGPSSSHTMGPMLAAGRFIGLASRLALPEGRLSLGCRLYGSLAYTGEGHGTIRAVLCGLLGLQPQSYDRATADAELAGLARSGTVRLPNGRVIGLPPEAVRVEKGARLPAHPNGMTFFLADADGTEILAESYYSIGGGFVLTADEMAAGPAMAGAEDVPYPFANAA